MQTARPGRAWRISSPSLRQGHAHHFPAAQGPHHDTHVPHIAASAWKRPGRTKPTAVVHAAMGCRGRGATSSRGKVELVSRRLVVGLSRACRCCGGVHAYVLTCACACSVCLRLCVRVFVCVCVRARARLRLCVFVSLCSWRECAGVCTCERREYLSHSQEVSEPYMHTQRTTAESKSRQGKTPWWLAHAPC